MEGGQQRPASRRFWQEAPAAVAVVQTPTLSPAVSHRARQHTAAGAAADRDRGIGAGRIASSTSGPTAVAAAALRGVASTTAPAPAVSPFRVSGASGSAAGAADGDAKKDSPELRKLGFTVQEASYSCPDGPATSLAQPGNTSCWKGGTGDGWVLLKLHEKSLLSFLRVRNRSTSEISVSISVRGKRRRDFVKVKRGLCLAHGTTTDVKIGHLPCTYVRVDGISRGAGGVSLNELVPVGIPARCVGLFMGPCMEDLTYKSTERLLFGPSLRTSLAPVCPRAALQRLGLPPSYLRPDGMGGLYAFNANDPDPIRRGPSQALLPGHRRRRSPLSQPPPPPPPGFAGGGGRGARVGAAFTSPPGVVRAGAAAVVGRAGFAGDVATGTNYLRGGDADGSSGVGGGGTGGGGVEPFDEEYSPASYGYDDPRGEGIGDAGGDRRGSGGGVPFAHAGGGVPGAADRDGRSRGGSRASGAAGAGARGAALAFGYVDEKRNQRQPISLQQQQQQQHSYSGSGVGRQFVGTRTGGGGGGGLWTAAAGVGAGIAAGDALSDQWGDYDEKEATGNEAAKNSDPYTTRGIGEAAEENQDVGFGYGFGRQETPVAMGRASPYPLGRHDEEAEEEEGDEESQSGYAEFGRGNGDGGSNGGVSLEGSAGGTVLNRRYRHAAAA